MLVIITPFLFDDPFSAELTATWVMAGAVLSAPVMCVLALAMRFVPYTDGHGDWNAGWTALLAAIAALGLAGAVYLVYVLEILKWRSEPVVQIVRRRRAEGNEVATTKR